MVKKFVSLILSLSAENISNSLQNCIILLDEPEVHLHPSGIRYMRDEILKIGINNYVIVSTHSHYFVDIDCPERHWIVEKNKKTILTQLGEAKNFTDDEVLSKAFGLALMRELIPNNVIVVEGYGDKKVIGYGLKIFAKDLIYTIKGAGGCSKVYSVASLLNDEKINTIVLLDDDDEGQKAKKDIIKNLKQNFSDNNVFTLKDVLNELPNASTVEDLYPLNFVNEFLSTKLEKEVNFVADQSIIFQLKKFDNSYSGTVNKEKLENLKTELTEAFLHKYKSSKIIKDEAIKYYQFVEVLVEKIKILNV